MFNIRDDEEVQSSARSSSPRQVVVTGVDVPFGQLVNLIFKAYFAALLASVVFSVVTVPLAILGAGLLTALMR